MIVRIGRETGRHSLAAGHAGGGPNNQMLQSLDQSDPAGGAAIRPLMANHDRPRMEKAGQMVRRLKLFCQKDQHQPKGADISQEGCRMTG